MRLEPALWIDESPRGPSPVNSLRVHVLGSLRDLIYKSSGRVEGTEDVPLTCALALQLALIALALECSCLKSTLMKAKVHILYPKDPCTQIVYTLASKYQYRGYFKA